MSSTGASSTDNWVHEFQPGIFGEPTPAEKTLTSPSDCWWESAGFPHNYVLQWVDARAGNKKWRTGEVPISPSFVWFNRSRGLSWWWLAVLDVARVFQRDRVRR
jgi:hypothetical protein